MVALMSATESAHRDPWYRRIARTGLWVRDTSLGTGGVALLLIVASAGWGASTIRLHDFAVSHMDYSAFAGWSVPIAFDGASVGLSISAFRASVNGRGAPIIRLGIVAFTALSAAMNYSGIGDRVGRDVAAVLPVAAVLLLESLLSEARHAFERRNQVAIRPRIHALRPLFAPIDTFKIVRTWVLAIPLPPAMATPAIAQTVVEPVVAVTPDNEPVTPVSAPARAATVTPILRSPESANVGTKTEAMRAVFEQHVAEGRIGELNGSRMAELAGASAPLGRRYFPRWLAEVRDTGSDETVCGAQ